MAPETSQFESSEMLATFLASTPLLEETWQLCSHADVAAQSSFAANVVGEVGYVAFSGVQAVVDSCRDLVELGDSGEGVFGSFPCHVEGKGAVMVHGGLLNLFLSLYQTQIFHQKISAVLSQCKSVVFSGHSLGGALASLSALWLSSYVRMASPPISILCITYGSPMLGNESFSQAILQERWAGNFLHVVAHHDILPRLLFVPSTSFISQIRSLFQFWQLSMTSPCFAKLAVQLSGEEKAELVKKVSACVEGRSSSDDDQEICPYWPFGSYMFCTDKGAICLDNAVSIVKFLHLTMTECSADSCIEDHLKYEAYVGNVCWQNLQKGSSLMTTSSSESSHEAGIALALQSSGISHQKAVYGTAMNSLGTTRQLGWRRNLNNAKMAVLLSKITPFRAEIEWYKVFCDNSEDQLGYYDSFKRRGASRRDFKVNMNRHRLGRFWDDLIDNLEQNQLSHDFHKLPKYVNASQFYKLLVEPLDIAEYYKTGKHIENGHYIEHGRAKRFKIFDKWWGERKVGDEESKPRSKYASLTQDSCFWARVEEARDFIFHVAGEIDLGRRLTLLSRIEKFEEYASAMIEKKEVSVDVMAKNSSYSLFREEWRDLRSQLKLLPHLQGFQDGMVQ